MKKPYEPRKKYSNEMKCFMIKNRGKYAIFYLKFLIASNNRQIIYARKNNNIPTYIRKINIYIDYTSILIYYNINLIDIKLV